MDAHALQKMVEQHLRKEIEKIIEEEGESAVKVCAENARRRIKEMTVNASAHLLQRFEMMSRDNVLTIRVRFEEDEK